MFIDPARPRSNSTPWSIESVEAQLSFLQGEALTIVEAAVTGSQLKATKDLIKGAFRNRIRYMREVSGLPLCGEGSVPRDILIEEFGQ